MEQGFRKIIAEAKGHTELVTKIDQGITDYLKTAGDIANFLYKPKSKFVISKVNRYLKGQGIDSIEDVQKAYSSTGTQIDTVKGKDGSTVNVYKAGKDTKKPVIRPSSSGTKPPAGYSSSGVSTTTQKIQDSIDAKANEGKYTKVSKEESFKDDIFGNKGGLMTKGKKK